MDKLDEKILAALSSNGRTPFLKIARDTGMTEGAIRARVKKLVKDKVIKRFTIELQTEVGALVLIATSHSMSTTKVADKIRALGVDMTYEISGNYDVACFVKGASVWEINATVERIRAVEGVMDTNTSMVLK
jgi:DNA-binding Lrp family transcriptional regulator